MTREDSALGAELREAAKRIGEMGDREFAARLRRRADLVARMLFAHNTNRPDDCPLCKLAGPLPNTKE